MLCCSWYWWLFKGFWTAVHPLFLIFLCSSRLSYLLLLVSEFNVVNIIFIHFFIWENKFTLIMQGYYFIWVFLLFSVQFSCNSSFMVVHYLYFYCVPVPIVLFIELYKTNLFKGCYFITYVLKLWLFFQTSNLF